MPPATRKRVVKKTVEKQAIAVLRTERVPIDSIKTYEKNPRIGNVDGIAKSLKEFGQYRPVLVNDRTKKILAGNHTYLGMRKNGEPEILVSFIDVDDVTAKAIVLADNKLADMGSYDEKLLGELLAGLDIELIDATGFSQSEVDDLTGLIDKAADDALTALEEAYDADPLGTRAVRNGLDDDGESINEDDDPLTGHLTDKFKEASDDLEGAYSLKDDMDLKDKDMVMPWGIPRIRPDMLAKPEDIPANLTAWAGSATKDWPDEDQWWLYNYGIDSTSGMKDISKVILAFYCFDEYFENWWWQPSKFTSKIINSGIKTVVMPDFSMWIDRPQAEWLWGLYRNRWLGRYFQEAGLKLIPDITWPGHNVEWTKKYVLPGLPKSPVIIMQLQTMNYQETKDKEILAAIKDIEEIMRLIVEHTEPELVLLYGTEAAAEWVDGLQLGVKTQRIETRLKYLGDKSRNREKKVTL